MKADVLERWKVKEMLVILTGEQRVRSENIGFLNDLKIKNKT